MGKADRREQREKDREERWRSHISTYCNEPGEKGAVKMDLPRRVVEMNRVSMYKRRHCAGIQR